MTTLHIMLASGENLPNLIPALAPLNNDRGFKAGAALILTSADMRKQAEKLKRALEHSGVDSVQIYPEDCPDHDLGTIRKWANIKAEEITANYHNCRRILNLTGGTKLMTIAFLEAFRERNTETIYCDTLHGRIEYMDDAKRDPRLPVNILKLKTCLAAQGYGIRNENLDTARIKAREELTRKLAGAAARIENLIRALNTAWYEYDTHNNVYDGVNAKCLGEEEQALIEKIKELGLLNSVLAFPDESSARYLGGGWLEEWCWIVGRELEGNEQGRRLTSDRWGISLKIDPFDATPGKNGYSLNELDAVYIHRNRMLLIECKTGMQVKTDDSQNILNKLEALGQQFGGRLNTKWLLSARPINARQTRERARRYGIRLIEPDELINLKEWVMEWMTQ
jgi:hypothetical protein